MSASDTIAIYSIAATVAAIIAAPIVAMWAGGWIQNKREERKEKINLLGILLSMRHNPLSPENFKALNMIDAVFANDRAVREAWSKCYAALNDGSLQNSPGYAIREDKRRDLMTAIIKVLKLEKKISTSDLLRAYAPTVITEIETLAVWDRIKKREDLRAEFIQRGIPFPDFTPMNYPPPPQATPPQQPPQAAPPQQPPQAPGGPGTSSN
jgi:hypothetical protein